MLPLSNCIMKNPRTTNGMMMKSALHGQSLSMKEVLSSRGSFLFRSPVSMNRGIRLDYFFGKIELRMLLMIDSKDMSLLRMPSFNLQLVLRHNFCSRSWSDPKTILCAVVVKSDSRCDCARGETCASPFPRSSLHMIRWLHAFAQPIETVLKFERGKSAETSNVEGRKLIGLVHQIFRARHVRMPAFSGIFG